jgi:hypothetical protein
MRKADDHKRDETALKSAMNTLAFSKSHSSFASGVTVIIKMQMHANFSDLVGNMTLPTAFALTCFLVFLRVIAQLTDF